ncbi:MAG: Ig-like domain-containing protein, partial [Anaerolineales bacterium]|nr:Ig-like domain-containing protein [Anaerolineales bacterium]
MNWKTWFFLGVGLVVISLLIGWQMAPRVEEIKPSTGDLHGRQPIQVSFSRPMKPTSFETHLILSPSMAGVLTWNDDATLLTFTPNKTWPSGETAAVQITAGAQSRILLPTLREYKSEIPISPTLLIYLWPADGKSNLYLSNPETGENQALTSEESGVLDYSISAEGDQLYFSVAAENGINAIKTLNRLTGQTSRVEECDHGLCTSPRISPDGNFLAYEFISREPGILPGITVLPLNGKTRLVMGEPDQYLENPLWSPSGWLVYYDQTQKGYQFWNPDSDETRFLPNETGGDGSWSADGRYFICSEILFTSETLAPRHLLLYD